MLGTFLEISIASEQLLKDIGQLEDFGFQSLQTNEILPHQYGVMSDGQMSIGLHQQTFKSPTLTFVLPDLKQHLDSLRALGIDFEHTTLGDDQFHQASFYDATEQRIALIEARTYSPTLLDEDQICEFGQFRHLLLPNSHGNDGLWQALQHSEEHRPLVHTSDECEKLTVVYKANLEEIVMRGTRNGWKNFSITADDSGLIKSPLGFDFLITG